MDRISNRFVFFRVKCSDLSLPWIFILQIRLVKKFSLRIAEFSRFFNWFGYKLDGEFMIFKNHDNDIITMHMLNGVSKQKGKLTKRIKKNEKLNFWKFDSFSDSSESIFFLLLDKNEIVISLDTFLGWWILMLKNRGEKWGKILSHGKMKSIASFIEQHWRFRNWFNLRWNGDEWNKKFW